jgi:hypothetical protein
MKDTKEIVQKKSYKMHMLVISILLIASYFIWFVDLHLVTKNIFLNKKIDEFNKPEEGNGDEIVHINDVPPQQGENDLEDIKSLELDHSKLASHKNLHADLLQIILALYSKQDCSELIIKLDNNICDEGCPKNIHNSINFLKDFNNINSYQTSNLVFPENGSFLKKLLGSLIIIEKIDPDKKRNQESIFEHVEVIANYINQFKILDKND